MERIRVVPVYKLTQCLVRSVIFSKPEASVTSSFYSDVFYTVVVSRRTRKIFKSTVHIAGGTTLLYCDTCRLSTMTEDDARKTSVLQDLCQGS